MTQRRLILYKRIEWYALMIVGERLWYLPIYDGVRAYNIGFTMEMPLSYSIPTAQLPGALDFLAQGKVL